MALVCGGGGPGGARVTAMVESAPSRSNGLPATEPFCFACDSIHASMLRSLSSLLLGASALMRALPVEGTPQRLRLHTQAAQPKAQAPVCLPTLAPLRQQPRPYQRTPESGLISMRWTSPVALGLASRLPLIARRWHREICMSRQTTHLHCAPVI